MVTVRRAGQDGKENSNHLGLRPLQSAEVTHPRVLAVRLGHEISTSPFQTETEQKYLILVLLGLSL